MRKLPSLIVGALLVLAVGYYLLPNESEAPSGRILMQNKAGRVLFDHKAHRGAHGIDCQTCHHNAPTANTEALACKNCHGLEFDASFKGHSQTMPKENCAVCHHKTLEKKNWGHDDHLAFALPCTECHHPTQIEEYPQNCANCHNRRKTMGPILSLKDAVHTRCASCHGESFPGTAESASAELSTAETMKACVHCHGFAPSRGEDGQTLQAALVPCASCHKAEPSRLIPGIQSAFHTLCIGCHKTQGKGPVDNCAQCHEKAGKP